MQSIEELIGAQLAAQEQAEIARKQNLESQLEQRLAKQTPNFNLAPMASVIEQLGGVGPGVSRSLQEAANKSDQDQSEIDALAAQIGQPQRQGGGNPMDQMLKLRDQEIRQQIAQQRGNQTKLPTGYEVGPDGGLQPIKGTRDWRAMEKESRQLRAAQARAERAGGTLIRDAATALETLEKYGRWAGGWGSLLSRIPESQAKSLKADLDSLQGNIAVDQLLNIKREGAGLGQVPQAQLKMLSSLFGGFDQDMDVEKLKENLRDVMELYEEIVEAEGGEPFKFAIQRGYNPDTGKIDHAFADPNAPALEVNEGARQWPTLEERRARRRQQGAAQRAGGRRGGGARQPAPRPDPFAAERARRTGGEGQ